MEDIKAEEIIEQYKNLEENLPQDEGENLIKVEEK